MAWRSHRASSLPWASSSLWAANCHPRKTCRMARPPPSSAIACGEIDSHRSSQALGKTIVLDGADFTIVGILPPEFRFWTDTDVYTSLAQG